jgi:hypothetical protein
MVSIPSLQADTAKDGRAACPVARRTGTRVRSRGDVALDLGGVGRGHSRWPIRVVALDGDVPGRAVDRLASLDHDPRSDV